jgi:hypothetical protein
VIRIQRCRELAKRDEETKQAASQDVLLNAASALFRSSALFTLLTFGAWEKCSALGWAGLLWAGLPRADQVANPAKDARCSRHGR